MNCWRQIIILSLVLLTSLVGVNAQITLTQHKTSNYYIVVPHDSSAIEGHAARELQFFIAEASGAILPIVTDNQYNGKFFISIGKTKQAKNIYKQFENQIVDDGFMLYSNTFSIFIIGNKGKSSLYGAYHFVEFVLGGRMLTPDAIIIPPNDNISVFPLMDIQNPSFRYREVLYLFPNLSQRYADWHKLSNREDLNREWGMFVHTFKRLIPVNQYFETHPEWFSEIHGQRVKDGQLCLSNPEVLDELCKNLAIEMNKRPDLKIWSVSQNDNENGCTCPKCKHLDSINGSKSGSLIYFINEVAKRFPDKTISTLAYQHTRKAPIREKPLPNVNIMFCSIECQRQLPFVDNPKEVGFIKDMEDWTKLTDNIFVWDYVVQFRNMMNPFPNLHVLQPNLQFFRDNHVTMMFEQGTGARNVTEMMEWRTYLIAKLLWNVDIDVMRLREDFLTNYYGDAAPFILNYLNEMQLALIHSNKPLTIYGYPIDGKDGYLHPDKIKEYQQFIQNAYQAVKGNEQLTERVRFVEMQLDFAVLDLAMSDLSEEISYFKMENGKKIVREEMIAKAERFVQDCDNYGVKILEEMGYPPQQFLENIRYYISKSLIPNLALGKKVTLLTESSDAYPVGGAKALNDGLFGIVNYHYNWLGFHGKHLDAIVDLDTISSLTEISLDFFFYPLSWIYIPEKVEFYVSNDAENWKEVGTMTYQNKEVLTQAKIEKMSSGIINEKARYVRVKAFSILKNPEWHRGYGQDCWIFTDEIVIK